MPGTSPPRHASASEPRSPRRCPRSPNIQRPQPREHYPDQHSHQPCPIMRSPEAGTSRRRAAPPPKVRHGRKLDTPDREPLNHIQGPDQFPHSDPGQQVPDHPGRDHPGLTEPQMRRHHHQHRKDRGVPAPTVIRTSGNYRSHCAGSRASQLIRSAGSAGHTPAAGAPAPLPDAGVLRRPHICRRPIDPGRFRDHVPGNTQPHRHRSHRLPWQDAIAG